MKLIWNPDLIKKTRRCLDKMEYPEETWDMRIYNELKLKSKTSILLPDLEDLTDEQR